MTLWIIFAVMTAVAVLAVLWPLGSSAKPAGTLAGGSDRFVYQDQLQEVDRDRASGLIGEPEAESARVEISRRLLAAADAEAKATASVAPVTRATWHRRAAAIAVIVIVPAVALGFYLKLGSPAVPGQSAFARADAPPSDQSVESQSVESQSVESLVSQVEAHLAHDPNDGKGWDVIAPVYLRMGRFDDAVVARRKAIALNGESAERESGLGEALVAAANGVVTDEAKLAFQRAVAADANEPKARYFLGLADEQDGNRAAAAAKWRALVGSAPANAPWADFVRAALARVTGEAAASGPSASDVVAADAMTDAQRAEMIRGMVQQLAGRLHADGSDVQGWLKLVRSYAVLGDRDKAKDAASDARHALSNHPDQVKRIDDLVKDLGLAG
jgi:cytochrome c-type biogenesis protein CcmH